MQVGLRQFDAATLDWLRDAATQPGATRSGLARDLCDRADWRNASGAPCEASARKLLPRLAGRLGITLPAPGRTIPPGKAGVPPPVPDREIRCTLEDLGALRLVPVEDTASRRSWEAMIDAWHPLGWSRAPGRQVRYWIESDRGLLGGINFASASWHQKARDRWIGWCDDARTAHLDAIVCNHRFLLGPWVHVAHLASHVLAAATARLADDWQAAGGRRPLLVYTYVAPEHAGSCYAGAGWQRCDEPTSGMPPGQTQRGPLRAVWMKPLAADWKPRLCAVPERSITKPVAVSLDENADWADHEYGRLSHPDGRLRERIKRMGRAWHVHRGASLPAIFPDRAERKAACRVLSNERVTMDHILESHQAATVERCARERVVLAIQDTTTVNDDGLQTTEGRVAIGGRGVGAQGLLAHVGLAVTPQGRALGVYTLDADFRHVVADGDGDRGDDESGKESRRWLDGLEKARQLKEACAGTRVVTVCDREADMWEMFQRASREGDALVIRAIVGDHLALTGPAGADHKGVSLTRRSLEHLPHVGLAVTDRDHPRADMWEMFQRASREGDALVIRASRARQCKVITDDGACEDLWAHVARQPACATRHRVIEACGGPRRRKQRETDLALRACRVRLAPPKDATDPTPVDLVAVSATETTPPGDGAPLHWLLLTTEGAPGPHQAEQTVAWYEARWSIETWFCVLKNGTRLTDRQRDSADD